MIEIHELHNSDDARRYLLHGLWLQRVLAPHPETVRPALEWALELASQGEPVPSTGFLSDVGHLALGGDRRIQRRRDLPFVPGFAPGLVRAYEDYVLGRLYADDAFERGAAALSRFHGRDRARGLVFLINQFRQHAGSGGAILGPAVIKALLLLPTGDLLAQAWDGISREVLHPLLPKFYEQIVAAIRNAGTILAPEDVFELEHGTALAEFSQRLAVRQVLQAAVAIEGSLSEQPPRPPSSRRNVPTHILDEDTYPVGGFSSISTRGSIESLLHSQLAYMDPPGQLRPDLFDIKFLRDELLYYARDENEFLRRRRTFVFALFPDLECDRVKDAGLPWQRTVLLLALLVVGVRKLTEWMSADALVFEFLWIETQEAKRLVLERTLLEILFRDQIAKGTVVFTDISSPQVAARCLLHARRSLCHCLTMSSTDRHVQARGTQVAHLRLSSASPVLRSDDHDISPRKSADPLEIWRAALESLFQIWV